MPDRPGPPQPPVSPGPALPYRSGRDRPPGRRHLRAVPLLPLAGRGLRPERARGAEGGARRGRLHPRHARGRGDARGRGHRPRHRVVPQRALAGLQDGRGHRPAPLRPVRAAGGGAARPRRGRLADGGVRGRRRAGRGRRHGGGRRARRRRWSSARPTRTWPSACAATGSSSSTAARASCATRRGCERSSASRRPRFPTGSRSWATVRTASPGCPGWGTASAAAVLARYGHLEDIPGAGRGLGRAGARRAAAGQRRSPSSASARSCSGKLATLRADAPIGVDVDALRWTGPRADFAAWAERLGTPALHARAAALASARAR